MNTKEIVHSVMRLNDQNDDATYYNICKHLITKRIIKADLEKDFIDLWDRGRVSQSKLYTNVRKRITTLVRQHKLHKDRTGKEVLISVNANPMPDLDDVMVHMLKRYPNWFGANIGGTSKGSGYYWVIEKFYDQLLEYMQR